MDIHDKTSIDALVTYVKRREPLTEHDYSPGRGDRILVLRFVLPGGGRRELAITPELWQHTSDVLSLTAYMEKYSWQTALSPESGRHLTLGDAGWIDPKP